VADEDWRVTFELADEGGLGGRVLQWLHEHEVARDARARLGDRVAVSGDSRTVFLYAGTEAAAREAEQVVAGLLADHDLEPSSVALDRWHPIEQRWEDARLPLPGTAAERQAEHERLEADEAAESDATGVAAWEVRIELASHDDADELAARLEAEGMSVVRRSTFLLVGAANEDDARELAQRLAAEAPPGAVIHVEPGGGQVWEAMPENPFAVFGGLAG
jgi:hypothetical protein